MARAVAVNDILETASYQNLDSQMGVNVRHWRISAITGVALTDEQVAIALSTALAPLYRAFMDATCLFVGVKAQIIKPQRWPAVTSTAGGGIGALASAPLPSQTAAVSKMITGLVGRSYRGRMYIAGFTEAANDLDSTLTAGAQAQVAALMAVWAAPFVTTVGADSVTMVPVIYSRKLDTTQTITGTALHTQWGTMRKRSHINRPDQFPVL